jgi:hypothetical protein
MKLSLCFDFKMVQQFIFGARCLKRGRIEMNRKMNLVSVLLVAFMGMVLAAGLASCSKKDGGAASAARIPKKVFNLDLPLTYNLPTAYVQMQGLPQLSVASLFDEANFITSATSEGYAVVCESKEAKDGTFTGVLLLSIAGNKALRMTISLRPDSDGEFLYITEISIKNLMSGEVTSMSYDGTQGSAANLAGFLVGMFDLFYDKDKLLAG